MCGGMVCGGMVCGGMICGVMVCRGMVCGGIVCGGMVCGGMVCRGADTTHSPVGQAYFLVIEQTRVEVHLTPYVGFCASTGLSLSWLLFIHARKSSWSRHTCRPLTYLQVEGEGHVSDHTASRDRV